MSEQLSMPNGFENGSVVSNGATRSFCALPRKLFEQAFDTPGVMVGVVDDTKFAGESLLFVSDILPGKHDSARGNSPQTEALHQFIQATESSQ